MTRHIYYTSEGYSQLHFDNKNSQFRNSIEKNQLDYLPTGSLQCSVVNITFTLKKKLETKSYQLGLRSSIPSHEIVRSSYFDNVIYTFSILPSDRLTINYPIPPTQYIYFNTNKDNLLSAKFEIIDLTTNNSFDLIDDSSEPTLIDIAVQIQTMNSFQILLESSDHHSQRFYSQNNNMNFTICLPERKELQGEQWGVICKGIQTSGKIWNIQDSSFNMSYTQYFVTESLDGVDRVDFLTFKNENLSIPPGYYSSKNKIVDLINSFFVKGKIQISVSTNFKGNVKIVSALTLDESRYLLQNSTSTLTISSSLANLLGFTIEKEEVELNFLSQKVYYATHPVNLSFGLPGNVFVQMSNLHSQLVGSHHFPILQMLCLKQNKNVQNILHFVVRENHENLLKTKLFSEISISITDVQGVQIKADNDFSTIIHLLFHQIGS